jgi:hypothetical protein
VAHREGAESAAGPVSVTVHLPDVEPVLGLMAAVARFCSTMTAEAVIALPDPAARALSQVQSIMWGLEHSKPEPEE